MSSDRPDTLIRITKDEALSPHVDDLVKRQMSLRGEPGVARDRRRRWYYQNWFVFSLVGLLGAVAAWGILEPFFNDNLYLQGAIEKIDMSASLVPDRFKDEDAKETSAPLLGSIELKGEQFLILRGAKVMLNDGSTKKLNLLELNRGQTIGVYAEYQRGRDGAVAVSDLIVASPPPQPPKRAKLNLDQLAAESRAAGMLLFPFVAAFVGLFIGAADGVVCRLPRRALLGAGVGFLVGFVGGFICGFVAELVYMPLSMLAVRQMGTGSSMSPFGFVIQMIGRGMAWALAGIAMGIGQGLALRSSRLIIYGLLGGLVGGLLGGLFFDPIDLILLEPNKPSAHWSRLIGFGVIGLSVGAMIGVVELLARDAWLRMTQGPLTGKEFLLFKDVMNVGASPRSDIYLFNDAQVADQHAIIRAVGDECEIEARQSTHAVLLNNYPVHRARLRHGDNVTIGRTSFVFQRRKG
jgi:hypothetical protein